MHRDHTGARFEIGNYQTQTDSAKKKKYAKRAGAAKKKKIVQKKEGCLVGGPKGLLGGIHHVEEPIFIPLLFVDLRDGS